MRLKSLTLQGFKSFPDKTVITFSDGITAIVGPNGSGKSNISDSIRWVLGEQGVKNLRGQKMEDVIFGGTKGRKGSGFAYAALSIENKERTLPIESDEVTISRKLYRDGESEYRINENTVRLKDVRELLMDTGLGKDGYCIIGQGKIADIVSAKSEERREIFEEASGISRFRYKKSEAERKLDQTEENLVRLRDIFSELQSRVEPLKKQSEKAKSFLKLSERKKQLEISLWSEKIEKLRLQLNELGDNKIIFQNNYGEINAVIEDLEKSIEEIYKKSQELLVLSDEKRREIQKIEEEISNKNARCAVLESERKRNKSDEEELLSLIEENKLSENEIFEKAQEERLLAEEKKKEVSSLEAKKLSFQEEAIKTLSEKEKLTSQRDKIVFEKEAFDKNLSQLIIKKASSDAVISEAKARFAEIKKNRLIIDENIKSIEKELKESLALEENLQSEIDSFKNIKSGYELKLENAKRELSKIESEISEIETKSNELSQRRNILAEMEKNMEGFANSVKFVMQQKNIGILKGIHKTVASILTTEKKYSVAIEIALGKASQNIVTDDEISARNAIALLKANKQGRATFLPLTSVKPKDSFEHDLTEEKGYIGIASDLVSYDEKYEDIILYLLGKIAIVDDIDNAIEISQKYKANFKIVTIDGQLLNKGGSMTGGSFNKKTSLLSRSVQISSLTEEIDTLEEKIKKKEATKAKAVINVSQIEEKLLMSDNALKGKNDELLELKTEVTVLKNSLLDAKNRKEMGEKELLNADEKINSLKTKNENDIKLAKELEEKVSSLIEESETIKAQIDSLAEKANKDRENISDISVEIIKSQKDLEGININLSHLENSLNEDKTERERQLKKIEELKENTISLAALEEKLKEEIKALKENIILNEESIKDINQEKLSLEEKTTALRQKSKEKSSERENAARDLVRADEKINTVQSSYDSIISKLWDEYSLTRSAAEEMAIHIGDNANEFEKELSLLKGKIRQMGSVNVSAIAEYEEVSERYNFLKTQIEDVEKSKQELLKIITELTANMKTMFSESFESIAENFSKIFRELFGGGNAELSLDDPDNVLESGISIKVEPPGKIIKHLSSLSGGEQAFIAVAIYFAILKVRPAPFCVLDEIEAALDEVNVVKYAKYLRNYTDKTQFIAITHRRGTMENADVLYGVTMQDEGVSKILKVDATKYDRK